MLSHDKKNYIEYAKMNLYVSNDMIGDDMNINKSKRDLKK